MRRVAAAPAGHAHKMAVVECFKGVDLTSAPSGVSLDRSPDAPNMVRDVPGRVRKRMGYHLVRQYPARVNGIHRFNGRAGVKELIHAGMALYDGAAQLAAGLADCRSQAFQLEGRLFIADGKRLLAYDGSSVRPAAQGAYCPLLTVSRAPDGGGTNYQPLNLLTGRFRERFLADGVSRVYQLSLSELTSAGAVVRIRSGEVWAELAGGFTVNAADGTVTFDTAPAESDCEGADNVEIEAEKTVAGYADRIDRCTVGTVFGVDGSQDRLFLSGNPDCPNLDFHSELGQPDYFPDTGYGRLGQDSCAVAGYLTLGSRLLAFKSRDDDGRTIIIRSGRLIDGRAEFPIENLLLAPGAVSPHAFAPAGEPLFLTAGGVYAVTSEDVTGDRVTRNRSYYINAALQREELSEAAAAVYKDFYIIAAGGRLYLLDLLAKDYRRDQPYSAHQYECYHFDHIGARVLTAGDTLRFGTADGRLCEFYTDPSDPASYNDCGAPIACRWTTPEFSGSSFFKNKDLLRYYLRVMPQPTTSVGVSAKRRGAWYLLKKDISVCRYLCFSALRFSAFTFCCDSDPQVVGGRMRIKKVPCGALRFENSGGNEPFALLGFGFEFRETGGIKQWH